MSERKCALCGKPQAEDFRPFCSRRCADLDLQRWLTGAYAFPAAEDEATEEGIDPAADVEGWDDP